MRSERKPASKPPSNSADTSGLRSALPVPPTTMPGWSTPSIVTVWVLKYVIASRKFGRWPERPYDVRSRSDDRMLVFGKNGSSVMTYEKPADGYVIQPNFEPNALLLSVRTPPDR